MHYLITCLISFSFLFNFSVSAQSSNVVAGPMVSFIDAYGTQMWFLLTSDAKKINVNIRDYDDEKLSEYEFDVVNKHQIDGDIPVTIILENLLPNKEYIASVFVDSVFIKEVDIFTKRPHLDDVQFLLGANLSGFDFSNHTQIFPHMQKTNSDFMVWLGNHTDFNNSSSMNTMINDYIDVRKNFYLNNFITSLPQIATWGELDFCDLNATWDMKDTTHLVFEMFWPNSLQKTYNYTYYDYGTYQRYTYNDLDLFLLDAMTFRSDSTLYGDRQIERLFQEIKNTGATFTIIASPTPFTFDSSESFLNYQEQFEYFLYRLSISGIDGVMLVSASQSDFSFNSSDLVNCSDCLYEFNIPPLNHGHYSLINITGKKKNRVLSFEVYNSNGERVFTKSLHQNDLQLN